MAILKFLQTHSKAQPVPTSRPIFLHSSSFIDDEEEEFEKPGLPLFHRRGSQDDRVTPSLLGPSTRLTFVLHSLNLILSLTSTCLFIATIPIWDANFRHARSLISGDYTDGIVLAPLFISLFMSIYFVLTEHTPLRNRFRPQISTTSSTGRTSNSLFSPRPKTLILTSLTILLTLAPALTVSATNSLALAWRGAQHNKTGLILCNLSNIFARQCQPLLYQIGGLQIGAIAAGALAWFIWAVMLVVAIRWWARERNEKDRMARERRRRRQEDRKRRRMDRHDRKLRATEAAAAAPLPPMPTVEAAFTRNNHDHDNNNNYDTNPTTGAYAQAQVSAFTRPANGPVLLNPGAGSPPRPHRGSSAARLAAYSVRPRETMQEWLSNRYAQDAYRSSALP